MRRVIHCACLAAFLLVSAVVCHPETTGRLYTYFKQNIGLHDGEISSIEQGKVVTKALESRMPSEVFVFGAVFINAQPAAYLKMAGDLNRLKALPNYLAVERFTDPPELSNLKGFELEANDVKDLKKCKAGDCEVQLPAEDIEQLQSKIDWSSPDAASQVNNLAQQMALEALMAYQKGGNAALGTYRDKKLPAQVSEQFRSLLSRSSALPEVLPTFNSYLLDYPNASLPDGSSFFFWEKVKFGLKPTLRINQQITAHTNGEYGPIDVVAIKQLYASHYFQTALDLNFCVPRKTGGFYFITVKGSEQAGLTGLKGSVVRKEAIDKTKSSLGKSLEAIKAQLEE